MAHDKSRILIKSQNLLEAACMGGQGLNFTFAIWKPPREIIPGKPDQDRNY